MSQKIEVDTKTFIRFWLVVLAMLMIAAFVYRALDGLLIVGAAIFLAVAINPLAKKIDGLTKKKRPTLSAVMAVVTVLSLVVASLFLIGPVVVNETARFLGQVPEILKQNEQGLSGVETFGKSLGISDFRNQLTSSLSSFSNSLLGNFGSTVVNSVGLLAGIMTSAILVTVLTLLFLLQGPAILEKIWSILAIRNSRETKIIKRTTERIGEVISRYVFGQITVAIIDGIVVAAAIFVLSLVFNFSPGLALPLGLVALIFYLIPMFGPIISAGLISLLLAFNHPLAGMSFAIFYLIYAQVENNLFAPKIQGEAMKLPSLAILTSITIGMYMFGLVGAIIAIPIAGAIKVLVEEYPNWREAKS